MLNFILLFIHLKKKFPQFDVICSLIFLLLPCNWKADLFVDFRQAHLFVQMKHYWRMLEFIGTKFDEVFIFTQKVATDPVKDVCLKTDGDSWVFNV